MTDLEQLPGTTGPRDEDLVQFVTHIYQHARSHKRKMLDRWEKYDRMMRNRIWSEQRAPQLPSPSSSEFFPTCATLVAWMTDQSPVIYAGPHPDLAEFDHKPDDALVAKKAHDMQIVLQSWWATARCPAPLEASLWDVFTFGAGLLCTGFDPVADHGKGRVTLRRVDPWAVLPDPDAESLDDAKFFLEVRQVSLIELMARYPERGHLVTPTDKPDADRRPDREGGIIPITQTGMQATGVTGLYPGTSTPGIPPLWPADRALGLRPEDFTGTALLIDAWVQETRQTTIAVGDEGRLVEVTVQEPYWRHVAIAGNVVLTPDTDNPFDHGHLPYVRIPAVQNGGFWSIPLSEHILPAQIALNRLLAAIQINLELTGNPVWLEPNNSGTSRQRMTNQPGARVPYNMGSKPEWAQPPSMPSQVPQTIEFWRNTIDRISGISAVARGASLRRREAAQAVDAVQEASFVRVRAVLRNMELALEQVTEQTASNIVQFYAEPRTIPEVGGSGTSGSDKYLTLGPNHFTYPQVVNGKIDQIPLKFATWIEAGSSQPISRAARIAEYNELRGQGAISLETYLRSHNIPNVEDEIGRVHKEAQEAQAAEGQQNSQPAGPQRAGE